jgi:MFS superfamily sulfate permease-like transporter
MRLLPDWLTGYQRAWLVPDVLAGVIVWSVVVPQAVAYAQIAGLPPSAGLAAAPGALLAFALLGTSRSLVVSATTATSALSAAAVGPLADGDAAQFCSGSRAAAAASSGGCGTSSNSSARRAAGPWPSVSRASQRSSRSPASRRSCPGR